jgi:hypothetical protein
MVTVIVQPHKDSVLGPLETRFDVVCVDCKIAIVERLPSIRAAYCQADAIGNHKCEGKVLAAKA